MGSEETINIGQLHPTHTAQPKESIFAKIKNVISMYFWYIVAIIFIIILAYVYSGGKKK